jgi:hypothetical protein
MLRLDALGNDCQRLLAALAHGLWRIDVTLVRTNGDDQLERLDDSQRYMLALRFERRPFQCGTAGPRAVVPHHHGLVLGKVLRHVDLLSGSIVTKPVRHGSCAR